MWNSQQKNFKNGLLLFLEKKSNLLTCLEVLNLWQVNPDFKEYFTQLLSNCPFQAFKWETPPVTQSTINNAFQCVLIDRPKLSRTANSSSFLEHMEKRPSDSVIEFQNLGKDATLIVPRKTNESTDYCHLASFLRSAPRQQTHDLWQLVGSSMEKNLTNTPKWLSTAGEGVPWLHVRIDNNPKYYGYRPYREMLK